MKLHRNTIMGFLMYWAPIATEEDIGMAVEILLTALARKDTPSRLVIHGHEIEFTKEFAEIRCRESPLVTLLSRQQTLLSTQQKAGAS